MRFVILFTCLVQFHFFAQNTKTALWLSAEVKREVFKNFTLAVEANSRFGTISGLETTFGELSAAYKFTKWFKPSVAFRVIGSKNKYGNTTASNRLNINLDFKKEIVKRLELGFRVRYQYAIANENSGASSEFEKSLRFKPEISYQIKKTIFTPSISGEWFYSLSPSPRQYTTTRYRFYAGTTMDLKGPNELNLNLIYGKALTGNRSDEWILSLAYCFEWKAAKKTNKDRETKPKK